MVMVSIKGILDEFSVKGLTFPDQTLPILAYGKKLEARH